jgi:hypothetical protein
MARLVQALVNGGPMEAVVPQIKVEEERKRRLTADYDALDGASAPEAFDYATIVQKRRERTADVQAVLNRQTTQARQMLRKLLDGKIGVELVTVDGQRGFRLTGRLNVGRLLRADVLRVIEVAGPAENNSPTVVAPYLKALRRVNGQSSALLPRVLLTATYGALHPSPSGNLLHLVIVSGSSARFVGAISAPSGAA